MKSDGKETLLYYGCEYWDERKMHMLEHIEQVVMIGQCTKNMYI